MHPTLLKNIEVRHLDGPVAGADVNKGSRRIDMANWEGAMFVVPIEDSVNGGVATLRIEQSASDSDHGMSALSGAVATKTSGRNDDLKGSLLVVDMYRPQKRYLRAVRVSETAKIGFSSLTVILYGPRKKPVAQGPTVSAGVSVTSPAES